MARREGLGPRCSFSRNADELDGKDSSEFAPLGRFEATQIIDRTGPFAAFRAVFPDGRTTIEDAVAEGGTVVTRWTFHGTHEREFAGIAPTGRRVTLAGINIDRIADGTFVERWYQMDRLALMQQLGVIPAPGQSDEAGPT